MTSKWETVRLSDILTLRYGKQMRERERRPGNVPVVGSAGIFGRHNDYNVSTAYSIVVGRKGTAGSVKWFDEPVWATDTSFWVEPKTEIVPKYLYLALTFADLPSLSAQTGVPGLNRDRAYSAMIPVPPLAEQRRIVDLIGALDDAIEAVEDRHDFIKNLYNELVCSAATGSSPKIALREILTEVKDRTVLEQSASYRIAGIERSGMGFIDRGEIVGSNISYPKLTQIKSGQLSYRKLTAWEGPISVADEDIDGAYLSPEFPVFDIDGSRYSKDLLRHLCTWPGFWEMMAARLTGSVLRRKRLNPSQLLEIELPVPPMKEQISIADELDAAKEVAEAATAQFAALRALRSELLSALLSGAHEIPESYDEVMHAV